MDHIKILKRAWHMVWNYRVLWVFGIILALTTGGGNFNPGGSSGGNHGSNGDFPPFDDFSWSWPEISPQMVTTLIIVGIALVCLIILLAIAAKVARYVAETALIQMVDQYEETGEKLGVRQGFRLGWSRTALQLFLIDLLISLPVTMVFIPLFVLAFAPLLLWVTESTVAGVIGTVATVGMFFLFLLLAIVVGVVLRALILFFRRACALENLGVIEAIRRGFEIVIRNWQDVLIMWLIMIGIGIGWAIGMIIITIVLIPVIILLIVVGGVLGGTPALIVWGLTNLFLEGVLPYILAAVVGIPIFLLVVSVPWLFLGGLMEVFKSGVWTLTYRELRALEGLAVENVRADLEELPESGG